MYHILKPGEEAALEAFLLPQLESSMFLLGNMRLSGLADGDRRAHGAYAGAFEADRIVGVVAHYWNGNLVTQSPPEHLSSLWRLATAASGRAVQGILGPAEQGWRVMEELALPPQAIAMADRETLYALPLDELVIPAALSEGRVRARRSRPEDLAQLAAWRTAYGIEALGAAATPELHRHNVDAMTRLTQARECWVVEADGELRAMTAFNARIREAVQVGGVYTPPPERGRGYARAVVAQSLLDARADGATTAVLFTSQENAAANRAYAALGFRVVGDYTIILLREPWEPLRH